MVMYVTGEWLLVIIIEATSGYWIRSDGYGFRNWSVLTAALLYSTFLLFFITDYLRLIESYGFSERQVERFDIRLGKQENRHGDDVADDQLRSRVRGRFQPAVHGDRHIDSSYQTHRHHFTDRVSGYVSQGYIRLMCFSLSISTYRFWFLNISYFQSNRLFTIVV